MLMTFLFSGRQGERSSAETAAAGQPPATAPSIYPAATSKEQRPASIMPTNSGRSRAARTTGHTVQRRTVYADSILGQSKLSCC